MFLYCGLHSSAQVAGTASKLRGVVRAAGARIAAVASEIGAEGANGDFGAALRAANGWSASLVVAFARKGDVFGRFFDDLFSRMQTGTGMLSAWVSLAPQIPGSRRGGALRWSCCRKSTSPSARREADRHRASETGLRGQTVARRAQVCHNMPVGILDP